MSTKPISWWSKDTVAVVTGANRGIGYDIVRLLAEQGLTVVLTARDSAKGQAAIDSLKAIGHNSVWFQPLDVLSSESAENLAKWLKTKFGGIDILVNNAAVFHSALTYEDAKDTVDTNYLGVKRVTEALLPLMRSSAAAARIVNVTSRAGLYTRLKSESLRQKFQDEDNYSYELIDSLAAKYVKDVKAGRADEEGWILNEAGKAPSTYSESKIFLNAYAIVLAKSLSKSQPADHKIFVASFCPGVTATEMLAQATSAGFETPDGFPQKTAAEGADTGVWLALLPAEEFAQKNGKFFGEREEYAFGWENPPF